MFLVLLRHLYDDFPVFLTPNRVDAVRFAEGMDWDPSGFDHIFRVKEKALAPVAIAIVEFSNCVPVKMELIRSYQSELDAKAV